MSIGLIILAAGESSRFGKPKQIAVFNGQTLIQRAVEAGLGSVCRPIVVVLGANAEGIEPQIEGSVRIVTNPNWRSGMASSIRCGLSAIENEVSGVVITLCDQPLITAEILNQFVQAAAHGLVAADYQNTLGVPALFGIEFFAALQALNGNCGARQILIQNKPRVFSIPCPEAALDIDTPGDFEQLRLKGKDCADNKA